MECGAKAWVEVFPKNRKNFSYKELQDFVRYENERMVEIVNLPNGELMVVNEEGKLIGLPVNELATDLWKEVYPIDEYPLNNDELIVGNALLCPSNMIK